MLQPRLQQSHIAVLSDERKQSDDLFPRAIKHRDLHLSGWEGRSSVSAHAGVNILFFLSRFFVKWTLRLKHWSSTARSNQRNCAETLLIRASRYGIGAWVNSNRKLLVEVRFLRFCPGSGSCASPLPDMGIMTLQISCIHAKYSVLLSCQKGWLEKALQPACLNLIPSK